MSTVKFDKFDKIATISLNDPEFKNAFGPEMADDLYASLAEVQRDEALRCLILTAEGSSFCSGGKFDAKQSSHMQEAGAAFLRKRAFPVMFALKNCRVPVITAINGPAVGFGLGLSLMGDVSYAARSMYFYMAFSGVGLVPDGGSTWTLPRLIGTKKAMELAMLGGKLNADEALTLGLINRVCDDNRLMEESMELATRLADSAKSVSLMRRAFWNTWQNSFEEQLELEAQLMDEASATEDFVEGATAFMEKRRPVFKGK